MKVSRTAAMETPHIRIHFLLLLTVAALIVQSKSDVVIQDTYHKLEKSLIQNRFVLHQMQEAFFPSQNLPPDSVHLNVCVTVGSVQSGNCDNSSLPGGEGNFSYCQKFQWSRSILLNLISDDQLLVLDNVLIERINHFIEHKVELKVPLQIDVLHCDVTVDDILEALMQLLPWVKTYARVHGQANENDMGFISVSYNKRVTGLQKTFLKNRAHFYRLTILCSFIFLNIATPIALAKSAYLYYPRIMDKSSTGDIRESLYRATAIAAFLFNIFYTASSIRHQFLHNIPTITSCIVHIVNHNCDIPSDTSVYQDEVLTLVAKLTIIPLAVFMELLASIYTVKTHFISQRRHCHPWKHCLLQTFHIFALWNILIAAQLFTMVAIPISGLLIIQPQMTIFLVLLIVILLAGLVFTAAYLLHVCQQPRRRLWCNPKHLGKKIIRLVLIVTTLGLIMTLLGLYELMLMVQVHIETGLKGVLLALLPSFPLSALGWYLKRRCQKRADTTSNGKALEQMADEQQSIDMSGYGRDEEPLPL